MRSRRDRVLLYLLAFVGASGLAACGADDDRGGSAAVRARQPGVAKVIVGAHATGRADAAYARGVVLGEIDYGSFRLLFIDERAAGGTASLAQLGFSVRDDLNRVYLDGQPLDTRQPAAVESRLEPALRRDELAHARAEGRPVRDGLYLIQLVGPVRDEWLADLAAEGLEIVSYIPENAYVVRARGPATAEIARLTGRHDYVQYAGDFHPAYRLSQALHATLARGASGPVDVTVQVVDGPTIDADLADLRSLAMDAGQEHALLGLRDVELTVDRARLPELATREYVFHIEERGPRVRLDEVQGQILAGNLAGDHVTGPGYLDFLAGKGFNRSQFGSFVVNVVDDAPSLTGHPDLPDDRVAFAHNITEQGSLQEGHGFLNANIVAGFNAGIGSPMQDARGFHYGLGIAPFARVGATAIFGFEGASENQWEADAYAAGARISTNSWGFTGFDATQYDANAQTYDQIVRDAQPAVPGMQQLIVVFAAGNAGPNESSVASPATAKNVIAVGASENDRPAGADGCGIGEAGANSANDVINFSSRGPVGIFFGGDGRVKPDLMAPGTHIQAGIPQSHYFGSSVCTQYFPFGQTLYGWSSGTSHSCPAVAGGAALVYQDFLNKGRPAPSPAMVKGYLMDSAAYMTGAGAGDTLPSNNQGMGRMDLGRAFDATPRLLVDQTEILGATGQTFTLSGSVASAGQPFRVTLAWSDAPGTTAGAPWVNDLDLEVSIGGVTYLGNVFNGRESAPGGATDIKNNVESVFLPAGVTGDFTITVRATNLAGDGVPGNDDLTDQDFALIVYNATDGAPATPRIGPSPAALAFSGIAGGASPASQTLSIHNTGTGVLDFSTGADSPWLTLSSASGTAPASMTVSVNSTGLAPGRYSGAVTVNAPDAVDATVSVPVTLTVLSPTAERVADGGFEAGAAAWTLSGNALRSTGGFPHTGTAYGTLGLADSTSGSVSQAITIPGDARSADLSFWLNVTSEETTITTAYDRLFVEVLGTDGAVRTTLASFSNLDKGAAGAYLRRGPFNLLGFAGQTVVIRFRAVIDASLPTTFRVDDVSVQ